MKIKFIIDGYSPIAGHFVNGEVREFPVSLANALLRAQVAEKAAGGGSATPQKKDDDNNDKEK